MNPFKKLWELDKKLGQANLRKLEARKKRKADNKARKNPLSLHGTYFSSHPSIHGSDALRLEFREQGIGVFATNLNPKNRGELVKTFNWGEIMGFDSDVQTRTQDSQRFTATRMLATGVFALAIPKKTGFIEAKFSDILHTTSGDIELVDEIKTGTSDSLPNVLARQSIERHSVNSGYIKRFVNEHIVNRPKQQ